MPPPKAFIRLIFIQRYFLEERLRDLLEASNKEKAKIKDVVLSVVKNLSYYKK
ncbi:MAG: hypothetical protein GXZ02_03445 [Clostridiales bacterium]|nr:hypothetical protein [Clostridiales bacterium]